MRTASATTPKAKGRSETTDLSRGGAVESIAPEVRGMSERAFFLLMEKVFSLPEVAALVSQATDQQESG